MKPLPIGGLALLLLAVAAASFAAGEADPACPMGPPFQRLDIPARGIAWLEGQVDEGPCEPVEDSKWTRVPAGAGDLVVHADGPDGSGRFWELTVGLAPAHGAAPTRGFCMMATTVGWRSLQRYDRVPLEWGRRNGAGAGAELVFWDSFPTGDSESPAESAIVAWAYRLEGDRLVLDQEPTRQLAAELAAAYRVAIAEGGDALPALRWKAADQLETLAAGNCRLDGGWPP